MNVDEFVLNTFLELTSRTCPHGHEDSLVSDIMVNFFPEDIKKDDYGNYFYEIGKGSRTIFASHLDTVSKEYVEVKHLIDVDNFVKTDGKTTLGADDKAGVTVMLWMIKNKVPGFYYFFVGEEVGCIGSGLVSKHEDIKGKYDRIISFDRRGTNSVITFQSSGRSCSDKFADDLCDNLNATGLSYEKDTGGVYTDSAEFMDIIPECTNISVGYYKEHTINESQDINHLVSLAESCVLIDWESLVTDRDPSIKENKRYNNIWLDGYQDYYNTYDDSVDEKEDDDIFNMPKTYYDNGFDDDLQDITNDWTISLKNNKYDWIIDKFANNDDLTWHDLQIFKDCYLDMDDDYDVYFYEFLSEQLIDV